ncbi:GNAT family N-acetyltransferase [Streptomyces javensis]|uniref:GNAT family N-acetyltransferase n=1 Tax=Streptomyces javensis TaxID=114698 RepID=A0ABS0R8H6_9ACTN|nr:GNAT family N-acetyltransferase [Streptomyces javensis]MBI0313706.1 GNAT family N-acetyltransferase [Streptomyces javensis]
MTDTFQREPRQSLAAVPTRALAPGGPVRWAALGWDDPAAAELRALMDAEIKPRYAAFGPRPHLPPPPTADEIAVTWIAFTGSGEPVATAALRALPGDRWEIKRVFVRADHRGRGLAAVALAAVEASAAERGVAELMLQTGVRQPEAAALYAREGWYRIPPYPPYSRDPYSVCFAKWLPATGDGVAPTLLPGHPWASGNTSRPRPS